MSIIKLPVLFLTDLVALPGMVMPIELDDAARAAVDAARSHSDGHLLVAPRLEDRYASYGVEASIVQMGRLASGEPAAVIRAERRVRIGSGVSGPGAALWVEAEALDTDGSDSEEVRKLAAEYKALVIATLQRRDAWQVIDTVNKVTDPSTLADLAGYAPYLTDGQKRELLETPDVATQAPLVDRVDPGPHRRDRSQRQDCRRRSGRHGEEPTRVLTPSAAQRHPQGARRGRARRCPGLSDPGRGGAAARRRAEGSDARGRQTRAGQ